MASLGWLRRATPGGCRLALVVAAVAAWVSAAGAVAAEPPIAHDDLNCLGELTAAYGALEVADYARAEQHYRAAVDKADSSTLRFQALFGLGSTYIAVGRFPAAVEALEAAKQLRPENAETLYLLGLAYQGADRVDEAVAALEASSLLAPDLAQARYDLSVLYGRLGWHVQMEKACRDVLELEPEHADARLGLAVALYHQGRYEEAIAAFERALELRPEDPGALYGGGIAQLYSGDKDGAVSRYVALREVDAKLAEDLYQRILRSENPP